MTQEEFDTSIEMLKHMPNIPIADPNAPGEQETAHNFFNYTKHIVVGSFSSVRELLFKHDIKWRMEDYDVAIDKLVDAIDDYHNVVECLTLQKEFVPHDPLGVPMEPRCIFNDAELSRFRLVERTNDSINAWYEQTVDFVCLMQAILVEVVRKRRPLRYHHEMKMSFQ